MTAAQCGTGAERSRTDELKGEYMREPARKEVYSIVPPGNLHPAVYFLGIIKNSVDFGLSLV